MKTNKPKKEKCISCGKEVNILETTNINARLNYVEGAGQLCPECEMDIYSEKDKRTLELFI